MEKQRKNKLIVHGFYRGASRVKINMEKQNSVLFVYINEKLLREHNKFDGVMRL